MTLLDAGLALLHCQFMIHDSEICGVDKLVVLLKAYGQISYLKKKKKTIGFESVNVYFST